MCLFIFSIRVGKTLLIKLKILIEHVFFYHNFNSVWNLLSEQNLWRIFEWLNVIFSVTVYWKHSILSLDIVFHIRKIHANMCMNSPDCLMNLVSAFAFQMSAHNHCILDDWNIRQMIFHVIYSSFSQRNDSTSIWNAIGFILFCWWLPCDAQQSGLCIRWRFMCIKWHVVHIGIGRSGCETKIQTNVSALCLFHQNSINKYKYELNTVVGTSLNVQFATFSSKWWFWIIH